MRWPDHAIWWHVYPLGFTGAERAALPPGAPPEHRLERIAGWLDHLVALGCNGLALGPVFASETHGYDTVDHFRVDPRLGDEDDLLRLVEAASGRGVRVLLDGVFNHVGRSFPRFADVQARGGASPYAGWFVPDGDGDFRTFEGHHKLVALHHDEPAVADYTVEVMSHWLERGVDGWRLDAAYAVPAEFWRTVTDRVRARFPDAWLLGEVIHGDYAGFVERSGLDSVTQYELWKAIWSSLNDRNFFELAHALTRHDGMLDTFVPQTFVGNHDVTRIASRLDDERHLAHALVVLLTTAGVPSIYAGDEFAFHGIKEEREGGDDAIRPAFPARPDETPGHGAPHHRLHQDLIGVRRRHPWLVRAHTKVATLTNTAFSYTVGQGDERLGVVLNLADEPAKADLPAAGWTRIAGDADFHGEGALIPPYGWAIAHP
ncbi:alpha-amylase family protein [Actinomadura nitritigenes]|uniref:Alpha-amylase family protein n=1 Tax=Actinomadura nitritigenes TaxID=134602 RepID=A0ABS3QWP8_9ACTN|nr:alpha-amylase family protein [Actinomadura nitritigenes]MBO2438403.1 alpha-amylase family protein [Actinomadura nitritigenes]